MNYRTLGKTGLSVSEVGLGGIPIQRISLPEAVSVIQKAHAAGVNFIDTGIVYTDSEEKIGQAVKGYRQEWVLISKSPNITYQGMKEDLEKSLKNTGLTFWDLYQIHHVKDEQMLKATLGENGALKALKEAQKEGKIKHIGVTGHNIETLLSAAKTGFFDTVMTNFNYKEREAAEELIPYCRDNNIGVIIMKPLAGGTFRNAASAIKFCLSTPGVSSVIPGIATEKELKEDVLDVLENPGFTSEDEKKLKEEVVAIGAPFCRACGYCITQDNGCPTHINITLFLRLEGYFQKYGASDWIMEAYRKNPVPPASCTLCGHCERVCPFYLPIIRSFRDLKVRKEAEKRWGGKKTVVAGPLREYQKEYQDFVELTQRNLGSNHQVPLAYFNYPKPANGGQKVTVRGLWQNLKTARVMSKEEETGLLKELAGKMGIAEKGIKTFENLLTLADYNNIVDLMRILPQKTNSFDESKTS
ncbi:MAG: aldo/keto reductase [bacterium]|nr:aldo/keto reductase [bacterium]